MNIYILGNGFDMAHGLSTSYKNFLYFIYNKYVCEIDENNFISNFLEIMSSSKVNMTEVEDDMDRKGVPTGIKSSYAVKWFISLFNYIESDEELWCSLEKSLGLISYKSIMDEYANYDWDDLFKEDAYYNSLTYRWSEIAQLLKVWLREWIDSIDINKDRYDKFYKEIHSKESYFINFNYTLTLEEIYQIESGSILHIHGKKGDKEYIFGHGNLQKNDENDDFRLSPSFTDNTSDVDKIFSKSLQIGKLDDFISNLKVKPTENIVINVIGFSFGDVDNMYIRKLIEKFPNAKWNLHKYNNQEKEYMLKLKNDFSVNPKSITTSNILT